MLLLLLFVSEMCNYLLLYECQHDRRESNMSVCSKQCSMSDGIGPRTDVQASGSVFLLAGHNDGHICLLDQDSGHVVFKVEVGLRSVFLLSSGLACSHFAMTSFYDGM